MPSGSGLRVEVGGMRLDLDAAAALADLTQAGLAPTVVAVYSNAARAGRLGRSVEEFHAAVDRLARDTCTDGDRCLPDGRQRCRRHAPRTDRGPWRAGR